MSESQTTPPSLAAFIQRGILGFTVLSVAGFAPWAVTGRMLYRAIGEAGLYAVCAVIFIGLSGPLLHRLILGPGSLLRFYKLFAVAFTGYSIAWIVGWMSLGGHTGSVVGLLAGAAIFSIIVTSAFKARSAWLAITAVLFLTNAAGYFIGGWIEASAAAADGWLGFLTDRSTRVLVAKLLWGVSYGVGFGAGLGFAFHRAQLPSRV